MYFLSRPDVFPYKVERPKSLNIPKSLLEFSFLLSHQEKSNKKPVSCAMHNKLIRIFHSHEIKAIPSFET